MIKNFFIKNFRSIKNRLDISFEPTPLGDETYYENTFTKGDLTLSKVLACYGMNASGKSNIAIAFAALRELVIPLFNGPALPYYPFAFSNETKASPTEVGIEFSLDNLDDSFIYRYYVTFNADRVIEEKFEKMTSQKASLIYLRKTNEKYETSIDIGNAASNSTLLQAIIPSVVANRTFLSMFSSFNVPDLYDAYMFFATRFVNFSFAINSHIDYNPQKIARDDGLKDFTLNFLKAADFNIKDIYVKKSKTTSYIANQVVAQAERDSLFLQHEGDIDNCDLEFSNESLGTKKIILLAEVLYPILSKPSVVVIDELEASLHPELTKMIVTCFLDETINKYNSQLVFTSHETTLLDLNLLRRDQIIFVYKDSMNNGTYIKSLKEFHVRKTDSVEKSYLAGRYMTSPQVNQNMLGEPYEKDNPKTEIVNLFNKEIVKRKER